MRNLALLIMVIPVFAYGSFFKEGNRYFADDSQKAKSSEPRTAKRFSWEKHLDIQQDEFFREGEYTPPAPFIEVLRRPTKENILLFEKWQATRNLLLVRYEKARAQYSAKKGQVFVAQESPKTVQLDQLSKYRYVFYFDAKCPACNSMFETIGEMVDRGLQVEAVRLDRGPEPVRGFPIPWTAGGEKELKSGLFKSVPVLMAFDDSSSKALKMTGKLSLQQIADKIRR